MNHYAGAQEGVVMLLPHFMIKMANVFYCFKQHFFNKLHEVDLSCKISWCSAPLTDGLIDRLISLDFWSLVTVYEGQRTSLWALTSVGKMNQGSEGLRIHSLHLDLLLLGLPHVAGEHGGKVVRHGTQNQPAVKIHRINGSIWDM